METQGRLTRVTVETQVSGNIPFWILTWDDCQIYPSTSSLWIQVVPTDQVGEAGREETEVKDQVEEETEVKSEDQTANVSQPDQKVMQVIQRPQYWSCFSFLFLSIWNVFIWRLWNLFLIDPSLTANINFLKVKPASNVFFYRIIFMFSISEKLWRRNARTTRATRSTWSLLFQPIFIVVSQIVDYFCVKIFCRSPSS